MRPNVEFRVDLPKTNLGLAKSHLQKHVAMHKKPPPTIAKLKFHKSRKSNPPSFLDFISISQLFQWIFLFSPICPHQNLAHIELSSSQSLTSSWKTPIVYVRMDCATAFINTSFLALDSNFHFRPSIFFPNPFLNKREGLVFWPSNQCRKLQVGIKPVHLFNSQGTLYPIFLFHCCIAIEENWRLLKIDALTWSCCI